MPFSTRRAEDVAPYHEGHEGLARDELLQRPQARLRHLRGGGERIRRRERLLTWREVSDTLAPTRTDSPGWSARLSGLVRTTLRPGPHDSPPYSEASTAESCGKDGGESRQGRRRNEGFRGAGALRENENEKERKTQQ